MATPLKRYGRQESREHHVPLKVGMKIAGDHIREFGPKYYPAVERLEKRLKKKK
jgi:hypothetical protein